MALWQIHMDVAVGREMDLNVITLTKIKGSDSHDSTLYCAL
jgi:hypothetical protein